eukprot:521155_1
MIKTSYYYYICLVLWILLTFILSCILVIELWTYCYKSNSEISDGSSMNRNISNISGKKTHYLRPNYLFPILSYIFYLMCAISGLIFPFLITVCYWSTIFGTISYSLGKMWMYLAFLYRLHFVFMDTIYEYNWKLIITMMSCVITYSILLMIINTFTMSSNIIQIDNISLYICDSKFQFGVVETTVLFDIISNSVCCYLFTRPLIIISKPNDGNSQSRIYYVALKCIILTFTAVSSTIIILAFLAVSGWTSFVTIDICINAVVIMLFKQEYGKYYRIICCGFIKLCSKCFYK